MPCVSPMGSRAFLLMGHPLAWAVRGSQGPQKHMSTCPSCCTEVQGWARDRPLKSGKCGSWPRDVEPKKKINPNDSLSNYSTSQSNPRMSVTRLDGLPLGKSLWPPLSTSNLKKPASPKARDTGLSSWLCLQSSLKGRKEGKGGREGGRDPGKGRDCSFTMRKTRYFRKQQLSLIGTYTLFELCSPKCLY